MSDFNELCDLYGLSPGDPDSIDKLIFLINEDDISEEEEIEFMEEQGFEIDDEGFDDE